MPNGSLSGELASWQCSTVVHCTTVACTLEAYGKPPAIMPFVNEINYPQGQPLFQGLFDSLCRVLFHRSLMLLMRYRVCVHIRLLQGYTC